MPPRQWRFRVEDILSAIGRIQHYISGMTYEQFCADQRTIDAVLRNFEVIGEAARHIPSAVEARHPNVPWRQMRAMRNGLIHDYPEVELAMVWDAVQQDLAPLIPLLQSLLQSGDSGT